MAGTIHEVSVGRAGELLACGIMEAMGYRTVLCQQRNFDAILMHDDVHHYRVEIKTCSKEHLDKSGKTSRYSFTTATGTHQKIKLDTDKVDLLVLVALDIRRCYFIPVCDHSVLRKHIKRDEFLSNDEVQQIADALERIEDFKCGKH
jgi:hypothetical protein